MGKKIITSARVDKDVLSEAKGLGANTSIILENALKEFIQRNKLKTRGSVEHNGGTLEVEVLKETKTTDKKQVSAYHPSSNLGNPNSSSFSRLGLPSTSQPRIP